MAKIADPTPKEAKQLLETAGHAYDNESADALLAEAVESAAHYAPFFSAAKSEEQSRSE